MTSEGLESNRTIEFLAWVEVNKNRLVIGAAVIAVVISAVATQRWWSAEQERAASAALLRVGMAEGISLSATLKAADFLEVAQQYAGTRAAAQAHLLAAEALFNEGQYSEARGEFEIARGVLQDDGLRAAALFGVAASHDALGKAEAALAAYQDVVARHSTAAVANQARLEIAELLEARGDLEDAARAYVELASLGGTVWGSTADEFRDGLLMRNPELAALLEADAPVEVVTETVIEPATNKVEGGS